MNYLALICAWLSHVYAEGDVVLTGIPATPHGAVSDPIYSDYGALGHLEIKCDYKCNCHASSQGGEYRACPSYLYPWIDHGVVKGKCAVNIQEPKFLKGLRDTVWFACHSLPNDYLQQVKQHNLKVDSALQDEKDLLPNMNMLYTRENALLGTTLVYSMHRNGHINSFTNKGVRFRSDITDFDVVCDDACGCTLHPEKSSISLIDPKAPEKGHLMVEKQAIHCGMAQSSVPRRPDSKHRCILDFFTAHPLNGHITGDLYCTSRSFITGLDMDPEYRDPKPRASEADPFSTLVIVPMVSSPEFTVKSAMVDRIPYRFVCSDACNCVMHVDPELYRGPSINQYLIDCPLEIPHRPVRIQRCAVTVQHGLLPRTHSDRFSIDDEFICTSRPADNDDILTFQRSHVKTTFSNQKNFEKVPEPTVEHFKAEELEQPRHYSHHSSVVDWDDEPSEIKTVSYKSDHSPTSEISRDSASSGLRASMTDEEIMESIMSY